MESIAYTAAAQDSLASALQEAIKRRAAQIEPEHLLLALLSPASGTAWSLLTGSIGDPLPLRQYAQAALSENQIGQSEASPVYSYRTERALREASDEAARSGKAEVDTADLLLGLLDEGGAAAQILRKTGLDAQSLRFWLRKHPDLVFQPATPAVAAPEQRIVREDDRPLREALPHLISWPSILVLIALLIGGAVLIAQPQLSKIGVVVFVVGGWILSLCAHEFAHAFVADLGGDHSVRANGYLSFNPLKYTNLFLSIILPIAFLFMGGIGLPGGAVYINPARLRGPKWRSLTSAAGPIASLIVTFVMALPFILGIATRSVVFAAPTFWSALALLVMLNIAGVILNLIPIPPLDGFGIVAPWLPSDLRRLMYSLGFIGIFLLFYLLWTSPTLNDTFWTTVFNFVQRLGVEPGLAGLGLQNFMFWQ
jgi:Zn-dependent protease